MVYEWDRLFIGSLGDGRAGGEVLWLSGSERRALEVLSRGVVVRIPSVARDVMKGVRLLIPDANLKRLTSYYIRCDMDDVKVRFVT